MNTTLGSKIFKLIKFDLKINKRLILGWSIAIFSIMFLYMILFSSIQEMANVKLEAMPEELLQFVGMSGMSDMGNYITYYGMIYKLILIAISIFAALFSANLLYKEEKTKSIEFLGALSVSRGEIFVSKLLTAFIGVLVVVISAVVSSFICGILNGGETFDLVDFMTISKTSSFTPFFFIALSFAIAAISAKQSPAMIGSMSVLVSYVLGYLGVLLKDNGDYLLYLSPFEKLSPTSVLDLSTDTLITLGIYSFIMVIVLIIGFQTYKKRDFVI